jgi:hypothetical protein
MREFPSFDFPMRDVRGAGQVIAGDLHWTDQSTPKILEAFQIANNWRDAHAYPMRSVRCSIIHYMGHNGLIGVTAARLKRMQAIRRKLLRIGLHLNQLQDIAGCRAILPSIADVRLLVQALRETRHLVRAEVDYITNPKADGYRSHHLMFNYRGRGAAKVFDGRRIEIQVRTRMQHSWATAVEAVGLFRGEDLKGDIGSSDWLRLFLLMSAEFAHAEGCPEPPGIPPRDLRIQEIKALNQKMEAAKTLDKLSHAAKWTDTAAFDPRSRPTYYLLKYNNSTNELAVEPFFAVKPAVASYDNAEEMDNVSGKNTTNVVLVEADKLENLKAAYPNYFGDVQLFSMQLGRIVKGQSVTEYKVRPQETVRPRPQEKPNLAWLKRRNQIRWLDK